MIGRYLTIARSVRSDVSDVKRPPSPDSAPLLGNGVAFYRDAFGTLEEWATHGDVVRLDFPTQEQYMVTGPDLIEEILVSNQDAFTVSQRQLDTFSDLEDDALAASTGERWERLRRALQPAFTWEGIRDYGDRMAERTAGHVERWSDGDRIDLLDEMRLLTVRILGDTLLGVDVDSDEEVILDAADALVEWADFRRFGHLLPDWVPTPAQHRFDAAVGRLDTYVDSVLETHPGGGDDVCSVLLAAHERGDVSWGEVRDNLTGLMLAGHDSTAVTLTYAWYELSRHPEILASVAAEVESVTGDGLPGVADFEALQRTQNVVDETLRLYPAAWAVSRQATEPVTIGEYDLPGGTQLMMPQWVVHRDPRFWERPETFDPSRWERETDRPEYAFFPFSGGPRHCIGMRFARTELLLALATMVDRVDVDVTVEAPLTFTPSVSLRPETDLSAVVRNG